MPYWEYEYPINIDWIQHSAKFRMPWLHCHDTYEIYFLDHGHNNVMYGEKLLWLSEGDVVLFAPKILHRAVGCDEHSRWCLYFSKEYLDEHFTEPAAERMLRCFGREVVHLSPAELRRFTALMHEFKFVHNNSPKDRYMLLGHILYLLNSASHSEQAEQSETNAVRLALSYINSNFLTIADFNDIVEASFVSKEHLCSAFKKSTGFTITQYINSLRINHACELLKSSSASITDISTACGFSSPTYFGYVFKEQVGQTPKDFRKSISS